jgi:hypothetical protein
MLPKGFGQQREVSESKKSSWFCVLSTTYRHAGRKLYCAESDFRITSTVDTLGLRPSAVNRRQHIDSLPSLGLDNDRRPFEPKPLTQPVDQKALERKVHLVRFIREHNKSRRTY